MSSILTNNGAMVALQTMKSINSDLGGIQDMISTGKKVANAKDNAAVWAISTVMESDVSAFKAVGDSLALGQSTVAVARNATEQVTDLLKEMKTKIISAQEENVDRGKIQDDVKALRDQITSVVEAAQFNGLNLLKGSDNVDILASLDRASDGTVTTSDITVKRNNLEQTESKWGGGAGLAESDDTALSDEGLDLTTPNKLDAQKSATITLADAGNNADIGDGSSLTMTIDGKNFTVNFADDLTGLNNTDTVRYLDADTSPPSADAIAEQFQQMLTIATTTDTGELAGRGITMEDTGTGEITIHTQRATDTSISIAGVAAGVQGLDLEATIADVSGGGNDLSAGAVASQDLDDATYAATLTSVKDSLTLNAGTPVEGTSYRVSLDGNDYDYVARNNDSLNDVADGLKAQLDAAGIEGLSVDVSKASDPTLTDVTLDFTYITGDSTDSDLSVSTQAGGTAGGGLEELADIDVSTEAGAESALVHIEGLIQTSIDAAAAFGSDEKRLEIQQDFISKLTDSMTSGIGSMVDANMEETAARLQALQVQQQLGTQALSIANQAPQNVLALFR